MKLNIGAVLARKGMTQSALADAIDVKKGFMSEIISNKKSPSLETLTRITEVLGVGIGELFDDEPALTVISAVLQPRPPGMEDEATPFDWHGFKDAKRSSDAIESAQAQLRHPETYQIKTPIPSLSLQTGDILVCDLARPYVDGDLILIGLSNSDGFNVRTLVRRAKGNLALSAEPGEEEPVIDLDSDSRAAWRGTVCGVVRLFT